MPSLMATDTDPLSPTSTASEEEYEYGSSQSTCGGWEQDQDQEEEQQWKQFHMMQQQQQQQQPSIMVKIEGEPSHNHIHVKREPLSPQPQPQAQPQMFPPPPITIKQESMTSSHPHLFPSYSKDDDYMQSFANDFLHNVPWNIGITPPVSPSPSHVKNQNQLYIPHDMAFPDSLSYHPSSPQSPFLSPMASPRATRCVSPSSLALPSSSPHMDHTLSFTLNRSPSPSYDPFASGNDSDSDTSQSITSTSTSTAPLQQPQPVPSQAPYVIVSPPSPVFTSTPSVISPTRASLAAYLSASPEIPTTAYTYAPQAVDTVDSTRKRASTSEEEDVTPRKKQKKHAAERDATLETGEHIHVSKIEYDKNNTIRVVRVTNPTSGSAYTVIHGADVGKVVERPGNISRLYTSFTNDEKKIMKIPSDYNYAAGQKAIVLTKQGVSRLIYDTKKVIARPAYQQWLKQNILTLMDQ